MGLRASWIGINGLSRDCGIAATGLHGNAEFRGGNVIVLECDWRVIYGVCLGWRKLTVAAEFGLAPRLAPQIPAIIV